MHQCGYCTFKSNRKYNLKIHEQRIHAVQSGFGSVVNSTTHIPIEKYKEVCNATNQWKICYEKLQKEHTLLQEHRREGTTHIPIEKHNEVVGIAHGWKKECEKMQEAYQLLGEETNAIITYLENVLNANNIRYNLELA